MARDDELQAALTAIHAGRRARDLESRTLDFKEDARSADESVRILVDAALCFANGAGGVIAVGVANKESGPAAFKGSALNPDELKRRIYELTMPRLLVDVTPEDHFGAHLIMVYVSESPEIHSDTQGRAPRRVGTDCLAMTPQEQALLREERLGVDWSAQTSDRKASEVSPIAMALARQRLSTFTGPRRHLSKASDADILRALGVVTRDGKLLRAGETLLCDPRRGEGAQITYQYLATPGGEPVAVQRLRPPLLVAFQRVLELIQARRNLTPLNLPDGQQIQIEDFPELAVREAIANAVIHRDYHMHLPVAVEHSPSAIVVTSPGPLVSGVTPTNILTHPSKPRNPSLASAARLLGLAEEIGRGMDRMFREMIRSGKDVPELQEYHDRVRISFVGGAPNTNIARYIAQLPESERDDVDTMLVVLRACSRQTTTATEMATILQKTSDEAEAVLRRLSADPVAMLEPTRESARRRRPSYRLRGDALKLLGSAVTYRRRTTDEIDRKIIAHVREYGKVTNRTVQNLLDVSMTRAKQILQDLVAREVILKISEHERGPGVEYGPGVRFPAKPRSRRIEGSAQQMKLSEAAKGKYLAR